MGVDDWIPDVEWPWSSGGPDEGFREVYEAYEEFYREASTPGGRPGKQAAAAQEFFDAVVEYYGAEDEDVTAATGAGLFVNADGGLEAGPMEEKYSEEELYEYLGGEF